MKLQVGKKYKFYYGKNNPMNRLIHICAIVDNQVVFRTWSKKQKRWIYVIDPIFYFVGCYEQNILFEAGTTSSSVFFEEIDLVTYPF